MYRALFGCSDSVREKRRIGRGVVVDLRFLNVKEDRKSSVSFVSFPRHPNRGLDFFVFVM